MLNAIFRFDFASGSSSPQNIACLTPFQGRFQKFPSSLPKTNVSNFRDGKTPPKRCRCSSQGGSTVLRRRAFLHGAVCGRLSRSSVTPRHTASIDARPRTRATCRRRAKIRRSICVIMRWLCASSSQRQHRRLHRQTSSCLTSIENVSRIVTASEQGAPSISQPTANLVTHSLDWFRRTIPVLGKLFASFTDWYISQLISQPFTVHISGNKTHRKTCKNARWRHDGWPLWPWTKHFSGRYGH